MNGNNEQSHWVSDPFTFAENGVPKQHNTSQRGHHSTTSFNPEETLEDWNTLNQGGRGRNGGNPFEQSDMEVDDEEEDVYNYNGKGEQVARQSKFQRTSSLNSYGSLNHYGNQSHGRGPGSSSQSPFNILPPPPQNRNGHQQQPYPDLESDDFLPQLGAISEPKSRPPMQRSQSYGEHSRSRTITSHGVGFPNNSQRQQISTNSSHRNSSAGFMEAMNLTGNQNEHSSPRSPLTLPSSYTNGAEGNVRYESESDDESPSYSSPTKYMSQTPSGSQKRHQSISNTTQLGTKPQLITNGSLLKSFGIWDNLQSTEKIHKILTTYVKNSCGFKPEAATIHGILVKRANESPSRPSSSSSSQILLWFKTTPGSLQLLGKRSPGVVSFFDRVARALSIKPKDIKQSYRQIILLCSVTMGHMYESEQGYPKWKSTSFPKGYDSVKGNGKCIPNPQENQVVQGYTIAPCGTTSAGKKKHKLDYNEYIINDPGRVEVKYALDLEISP